MPRNPERRKAYAAAYREANKERLRAEARERMAKVPREVKAARTRALRATTKGQQYRRREHYAVAVRKGFSGSFAEWASSQCAGKALAAAVDARRLDVLVVHLPRHMDDAARRQAEAVEYRTRYWSDPEFRAAERQRQSARKHPEFGCITTALRLGLAHGANPNTRQGRLYALLGYTPADLRRHLEAQFDSSMSWGAFWRGEIHIDHIVPLCQFDTSDREGLRQSTRLSNLQPLWALDNLLKAASAA